MEINLDLQNIFVLYCYVFGKFGKLLNPTHFLLPQFTYLFSLNIVNLFNTY